MHHVNKCYLCDLLCVFLSYKLEQMSHLVNLFENYKRTVRFPNTGKKKIRKMRIGTWLKRKKVTNKHTFQLCKIFTKALQWLGFFSLFFLLNFNFWAICCACIPRINDDYEDYDVDDDNTTMMTTTTHHMFVSIHVWMQHIYGNNKDKTYLNILEPLLLVLSLPRGCRSLSSSFEFVGLFHRSLVSNVYGF